MSDWQDAVNLMKSNGRKAKRKASEKPIAGLRCWDCGLYIDNLRAGHYCSKCLVKRLKKYMGISGGDQNPLEKSSSSDGNEDSGTDDEIESEDD